MHMHRVHIYNVLICAMSTTTSCCKVLSPTSVTIQCIWPFADLVLCNCFTLMSMAMYCMCQVAVLHCSQRRLQELDDMFDEVSELEKEIGEFHNVLDFYFVHCT